MTNTIINSFVEVTTSETDAFDMTGAGDTLLVTSAGALASLNYGDGIYATGSAQSITVDGLVYSAQDTGVHMTGANSALIVNGDSQGQFGVKMNAGALDDSVYVGAAGQVAGTATGIMLEDTGGQVTNDGHIYGPEYGISSLESNGDTLTNDGVISTSGLVGLSDSAAIRVSLSEFETIANAGLVSGPAAIYIEIGSDAAISNTGTILGSLTVADKSQATIDNSGIWHGALDLDSSGNNSLTNSGKIHGGIAFGSGADAFANSGTLTGSVSFGSNSDTLTNTGTITGNVTFAGSVDQLTNGGTIHGDVTMGDADTLTNSGTIHGGVILGFDNTFASDGGAITGTITAGDNDYFDFSGSLGHETIAHFVAIGRTHDVIHFGNDDFANYAALQADMAQVGKDVVIRLDAGDTLVLDNTALVHLSSHDFTFGS